MQLEKLFELSIVSNFDCVHNITNVTLVYANELTFFVLDSRGIAMQMQDACKVYTKMCIHFEFFIGSKFYIIILLTLGACARALQYSVCLSVCLSVTTLLRA